MKQLKAVIPEILCRLEKLFPPAFFDIMVHLVVHLSDEALLRGPVQYGWMFPVERRLGYLKSTMRNKAKPEGSIAESYIGDECLIFCSRYLKDDIETTFNKLDRNMSKKVKKDRKLECMRGSLGIFLDGGPVGIGVAHKKINSEEAGKMHRYILDNCPEVLKYME